MGFSRKFEGRVNGEDRVCDYPVLEGNVIKLLRGKTFFKKFFPLNPFPKAFKSFRKMAWKKPFFKRVSSKISAPDD